MNKLHTLAHDEKLSRVLRVESEDLIQVTYGVNVNSDSVVTSVLDQRFDFSEVTHDELLLLASRALKVDMQAKWRKSDNRNDADVWCQTFSIRTHLDAAPKRVDPITKVNKAVAALSAEAKQALIDKLTEELAS